MIRVGIIGGTGFTAGELLRLLVFHDQAEIKFVFSTSSPGKKVAATHQDLIGITELEFTSEVDTEIDVLFLCLGHGHSKAFLEENHIPDSVRVIDLSNEFRIHEKFQGREFTYGLPELDKKNCETASNIANPGCFATAIQLALLPLAHEGLIHSDIHVNAVTGSTGAGGKLLPTTNFTWRDNNFSSYKVFSHQHEDEVIKSLKAKQASFGEEIWFVPNRGNFSRGIHASCYTGFEGSIEEATELFNDYYKGSPFVFLSEKELHLKQVVNTNKCLLYLKKHKDKLLITSILDNLLKGASGQAVQNMNLMFGIEETKGLKLKANYY